MKRAYGALVRYPEARRDDLVEELHGHRVADPHRWLEDADDPATRAWSSAQDELCAAALAGLPGRDRLRSRLAALVPGHVGAPVVAGDRWLWTRRLPGQDHAVVVAGDGPEEHAIGGGRVLVDPAAIDPSGTTTLDGWSPSHDGTRLAYLLSSGGDEESSLHVVDTRTGERLGGPVDRLRYSPLAWLPGGDALLYVRRLPPGAVPAGEEAFHRRLYLHRLGTDPDADDVLLFGDGLDPTAYLGVAVSHDGRWVAVSASLGTAPRNDLWVAALPENPAATPVRWVEAAVGLDAQTWPHLDRRGRLWLLTDLDAPRRRLCVADPASPAPSAWSEVVPEDPGANLEDVALAGEHLVLLRSRHGASEVSVAGRDGGPEVAVALPGVGSADLHGRRDEGPQLWVGWTSWAAPWRVLELDAERAATAPDAAPVPGAVEPPGVETATLLATSADGTEVRLTAVSAGGTAGRPRPTVLYGYGGFDVPMTPAWSSSIAAWVEAGGVYAVANLRGGSEEGEAWHRDGMREHKHHVFEDLEACADALVEGGWTTPGQLGIMGGSNGGLLVGAALTRRPAAYRAVVCSAPLLDMVRYERFGLGATWTDEYGTASDPEQLGWLLGYSPYHHVEGGVAYPAVLFTVFEGDSRVDPLHARKMCAALQHATTSDPDERPVLLRRETGVGHGARAVARSVALAADQLAWLADQLGLDLG